MEKIKAGNEIVGSRLKRPDALDSRSIILGLTKLTIEATPSLPQRTIGRRIGAESACSGPSLLPFRFV